MTQQDASEWLKQKPLGNNTRNNKVRDYLHKSLDVVVDEMIRRGVFDAARTLMFDIQQAFAVIDGLITPKEEIAYQRVQVGTVPMVNDTRPDDGI
jgi:hypothetical protein